MVLFISASFVSLVVARVPSVFPMQNGSRVFVVSTLCCRSFMTLVCFVSRFPSALQLTLFGGFATETKQETKKLPFLF